MEIALYRRNTNTCDKNTGCEPHTVLTLISNIIVTLITNRTVNNYYYSFREDARKGGDRTYDRWLERSNMTTSNSGMSIIARPWMRGFTYCVMQGNFHMITTQQQISKIGILQIQLILNGKIINIMET